MVKYRMASLLWSIGLTVTLIVLYYPVLVDLYKFSMEHSNNSHALIVPFISFYLIWRNIRLIDVNRIEPSKTGIVILIFSLFLYIIGHAGGIEILPRVSFVTSILGLALSVLGKTVFRNLLFPFLFLFFIVPIPVSVIGIVSFPLQLFVTKVSAAVIYALSIPVLREGNMLYFANTSLEVAEACSGIRSLEVFVMLSFLFSYLSEVRILGYSIFIGLAIPLALFVNLLRVSATGVLAHFFGAKVARGFLHDFSGVVIFLIGLAIFFLISKFIKENRRLSVRG